MEQQTQNPEEVYLEIEKGRKEFYKQQIERCDREISLRTSGIHLALQRGDKPNQEKLSQEQRTLEVEKNRWEERMR